MNIIFLSIFIGNFNSIEANHIFKRRQYFIGNINKYKDDNINKSEA